MTLLNIAYLYENFHTELKNMPLKIELSFQHPLLYAKYFIKVKVKIKKIK